MDEGLLLVSALQFFTIATFRIGPNVGISLNYW